MMCRKIKESLDKDLFEEMFYNVMYETFEPYDIVFNQGEIGRKMYFILEGDMAILLPTGKTTGRAITSR